MANFDNINKPHSPEWIKFNDNSKAAGFRGAFIKKYGGEFKHNGRWHQWIPPNEIELQPIRHKLHPNQGQIHFSNKKEVVAEVKTEINPQDPFKNRLIENNSVASRKRLYIITDPEGNETNVENFSEFCRQHGLNKSAMYEVARGKRNHHKKYTCRKKES